MEFGRDVGADDVLNADFCGFDFARLEKPSHGASLLFGYCFIFLLDHAEARDGELELDLELCLGVACVSFLLLGGRMGELDSL